MLETIVISNDAVLAYVKEKYEGKNYNNMHIVLVDSLYSDP